MDGWNILQSQRLCSSAWIVEWHFDEQLQWQMFYITISSIIMDGLFIILIPTAHTFRLKDPIRVPRYSWVTEVVSPT
eukprot:1158091-Pelagomonas_calceolata.AAC.4